MDTKKKINVFITGITGVMGRATLNEFINHLDKINLKLLVLNTKYDKNFITPYIEKYKNSIKVIWGDLCDYESVLKGITGSDYVLHIGGMVSPACDPYPYQTQKVNIGAAKNICKAVLAQSNKDNIKVCYIGSVAETGCRNYPIHWGRTGDPIFVSIYDHYALSKVIAEKIFVESGIKNWVVLRMSGILNPSLLEKMDPIIFHITLNGVIEWCTQVDAGRLMIQLVLQDLKGKLKDNFWNHFFNVGSGKEYRINNLDFEKNFFKYFNLPDPESVFEPNWFINKNFHGQYYLDSDKLEDLLHFRENITKDKYMERILNNVPFYFKLLRKLKLPKRLIAPFMKLYLKSIAYTKEYGTLDWIKNKNYKKISAYFGSLEDYNSLPKTWEEFKKIEIDKDIKSGEKFKLSHGYDENKPENLINFEDIKSAAKFRGGEVVSKNMTTGDLKTKLLWKCGYCKNVFEASPCLILLGGHWCPYCYIPEVKWDYDNIAKNCEFFSQDWYPNHRKNEENEYIFSDLFKKNVNTKSNSFNIYLKYFIIFFFVMLIYYIFFYLIRIIKK